MAATGGAANIIIIILRAVIGGIASRRLVMGGGRWGAIGACLGAACYKEYARLQGWALANAARNRSINMSHQCVR